MSLITIFLCLGTFLVMDFSTLTAGMRLTANITFPNVYTSAMLVTSDGKLLVGGKMGDKLPGLVMIDLLQPTSAQSVPNTPGTVFSMALLSDGKVLLTENTGDKTATLLELDGNGEARAVKEVTLNTGMENAHWYNLASDPDFSYDNAEGETIVVSGYDKDAQSFFIDVMSRDGEVITQLATAAAAELDISHMVVHDGDLFLSLAGTPPALRRFNMTSKTFVPNIGRLNLASAFGEDYTQFTQGRFDHRGNLYIGASRGCDSLRSMPLSSCGRVLRISPEGEKTVVVPRQEGRRELEQFYLQAVAVTPSGIAAAYVAAHLERTEGVVQLYEFDLDD